MKLILSSCDFMHPNSAKFIHDNLRKPITECKVLYFPNEKATEDKIKSGIYENRIASYGFQKDNIYVFNHLAPADFSFLPLDVIYISGGNTFGTLKRIRDTGFDKAIINYIHNGTIYIGGSAGAHIACANIAHVAKYDQDTFGLTDFSGLQLYHGILVCHYSEDRKSDLEYLKASQKYTVTALRDSDSLLIQDNQSLFIPYTPKH